MPQFYVVKDIGGGFDGLIIEGEVFEGNSELISVSRILDRNSIVGDRNVSLTLPRNCVFLNEECCEPTEDPGTREFAANNPFGKSIAEGHMEIGNLKVSYGQFESVLSVNIFDLTAKKTIFSQYFLKDFDGVKSCIEACLKSSGGSDAEDLVFQLRALKEAETNG